MTYEQAIAAIAKNCLELVEKIKELEVRVMLLEQDNANLKKNTPVA